MFVQRLTIQEQRTIKIEGDGLYQAQVNKQNSFSIQTSSSSDQIDIKIFPSESIYPIKIIRPHHHQWIINYIPKRIGQIEIYIYRNNKLLSNNPYKVNIFDINQICVSDLNESFINRLYQFGIDISRAGIGHLEIQIENGRIPCEILSNQSSQISVIFLPLYSGVYRIDIKFNGIPIPKSPFTCLINDIPRVTVSNHITHAHIGYTYSFDIYTPTKLLDILILAPSGHLTSFNQISINKNHQRIDYILNEIGLHEVNVRSKEQMDIYGSSFSLHAYDANEISVSDIPRFILFNEEVQFTVDASQAGEGQLEVEINDGQVPSQIETIANRKYLLKFTPKSNDPHLISIKFNGHEILDFPKECQVISSNDIQLHGPGLSTISIHTPTWFIIDTLHGGSSDLEVIIFTPTNEKLDPSTLLTSVGLRVDWTPIEIGTYTIKIVLHGKDIPGSPFHAKCYDSKKVLVHLPLTKSSVGRQTKVLVDTSKAGEGNLKISLTTSGHKLPTNIHALGNDQYEISFTPENSSPHHCHMYFNDELIPGSPFTINVLEKSRLMAIGKGLESIPVHIPTSFTVVTQDSHHGEIKCLIKGPNDHLISCIITKIDSNRYEITYTPDRVGEFRIEVYNNNIPIENSPFTARVFDINKIHIENLPSTIFVGSPTYFTIDATDCGAGNLEIAISRDGKNIPNYVENEGDARFRIKFLPEQSIPHHVQIKFNGIDIPNSPFLCTVYSNEFTLENYEYVPIHKPTKFLVKIQPNFLLNPNLYVDQLTPSGKLEKLLIKNGQISFVANEIGEHQLKFYSNEEKKVVLSKFLCQVYDINQIKINRLSSAIVHRLFKFTIDTSNAGKGVLVVKIKQNDKTLTHEQMKISNNVYKISFTPETTNDCNVEIIFNGDESLHPFIIPVEQYDSEQVHVSSIPNGIVGQPITFTIDTLKPKDLSIIITESHSDRILSHTMKPTFATKNQYEISFIPNQSRPHTILIYSNNKLISTHQVEISNQTKIRVHSINDGIVGVPCVFTVDTHGAGEGHLEVTISDGKRTLPAELKSIQTRKFDIAFIPEIASQHSISIAFNCIPIEGSPFLIQVKNPSNSSSDDEEEEEEEEEDDYEFILGGQLEGTKVGEVAWLICQTVITDIYEDFDFYILDPEKIRMKHTRIQDSAGRWRIEFEPTKAGLYQIQTDIHQTSFNLASMEILPIDYERTVYGERIVHPHVLNFISINSSNENLEIQLRNSHEKFLPIEIDKDESEWKIYFTLNEIDVYQLIIRNDCNEQIFDIHCVNEEVDLLRNGGIEDIARVIIEHTKISSDNVNVIVKDPLAHTIPAAFYRNSNNDLIIEYIPIRPDFHEIFIRTQNNLLDICPIRIMSFECEQKFEHVLRVQVKEILEHTFHDVIDLNNKLEIDITDSFERSIAFQRSKNAKGELTISFSPIRVGTHWMRIGNIENDSFALIPIFAYDDDYVPLSPVGTPPSENKSQPNPSSNTISEISEDQLSSKQIYSTLNPSIKSDSDMDLIDIQDLDDSQVRTISKFHYKDFDEQYQIQIHNANGDKLQHQTETLSNGRKMISYQVNLVGPVEIHILKDNQPIHSSPLIVQAFDPSMVYLLNIPKRIYVNTKNSFLIDAKQAGKGSLKVYIKDPNNRSIPVQIEKQSNDQLFVQFEPIILGFHTISILFNRIPIPTTPFEILVEHDSVLRLSQNKIVPSKSQESLPEISITTDNKDNRAFNQLEIQHFELLRKKFEQKQPIDVVFDPRRYPFKIYLQQSYPLINSDIQFLITHPQITYVNILLDNLSIPLQLIRKTPQNSLIQFHPQLAGDYSIFLNDFTGLSIGHCPYIFPIYNPYGIQIEPFNPLQPITDCHFICNIDNVGRGKFFLLSFYQSQPIRISYKIQSISKTRLRISFLPSKIGKYQIYLAYRNLPINETPIEIAVYDIERITLIAEHKEPVVVKTTVAYKINLSQAVEGQLRAELLSPEASKIPCRCYIHELNKSEYLIEYIPNEPGRYKLRIWFNNQLLKGKTIDTDVYSLLPIPISTIQIHKLTPKDLPKIGDEICLQILSDKQSIYAQILCEGTSIPCKIQQINQTNIWHLKFRPHLIGDYQIQLTHNGIALMNSPYIIQVKDLDEKTDLSGFTNKPCIIQVHTKSAMNSKVRAVVLLGGIQIPSKLFILNPSLLRIHFLPEEPGFYFMNIYHGEQPIDGSPFVIRIKRAQMIELSGKCLDYLRVNDLGIFRIHCHGQKGDVKAKIFYLSMNDHGQMISFQLCETYEQLKRFPSQIFLPSLTILLTARLRLTQERIKNLKLEEDNGHATISFQLIENSTQLPTNEQIINVLKTLIDKQTLNLVDPNRGLLHTIAGSLVIGSKDEAINVKLFPLPNGDFMGEFIPKKIGLYRIEIIFNGKPIDVNRFLTEVYDPTEVKITSVPKDIQLGVENSLEINMDKVRKVPMEVIITSPSGNLVPCKIDQTSNVRKIFFTPTETGLHYLKVKLGSNILPGTPMEMMVKNVKSVVAYGDGLQRGVEDKISVFMIDTNDLKGDINIRIESLNTVLKYNLERINDCLMKVSYIPHEVGLIRIHIQWNGKDIFNSPFTSIITNPERVTIVGGDWKSILNSENSMRIRINEQKIIQFETSNAGPGILKAKIENLEKEFIPIHLDQQGTVYTLKFTIVHEGKYDLIVSYADHLLSSMPIRIIANSLTAEYAQVKVYGRGLTEARVNEEVEFTIDVSRISTEKNIQPTVRLSNSDRHIDVRIRENEKERNVFVCSYKPTFPGIYSLSIHLLNKEIHGSPFKINISSANTNPSSNSKVICSGDALHMGIVGKEMQCLIDTRHVNPGELTAYCQGLHKNAICRIVDHQNGTFTLFIKPEETGKYILTIKYNGENVSGSPFTVKVSGQPDARKVRVSGPGIEHGVLSTFQSQFICETKGAGAGQLTVKIRGPKGAFRVEMERDHLQDRTIICRYNPTEPGDYLISVKWSGEHVYGSPFHTHIFENQDELYEYQHELNSYRLIGAKRKEIF